MKQVETNIYGVIAYKVIYLATSVQTGQLHINC